MALKIHVTYVLSISVAIVFLNLAAYEALQNESLHALFNILDGNTFVSMQELGSRPPCS